MSDSTSNNFYIFAVLRAPLHKLYNAVTLCKQGMILAAADIFAGMKTGAALPYQNVTGQHGLTTKAFHAQSFRF